MCIVIGLTTDGDAGMMFRESADCEAIVAVEEVEACLGGWKFGDGMLASKFWDFSLVLERWVIRAGGGDDEEMDEPSTSPTLISKSDQIGVLIAHQRRSG